MSTPTSTSPAAAAAPAPQSAPKAPTASATPAPAASPVAPKPAPAPHAAATSAAQSPTVAALMARLERYVDIMAPGRGTPKDTIAGQQKALYSILRGVLTTPNHADFVAAFRQTIAMFATHGEGALGARYVARGHSTVKLDMTQRRDLAYWTNVFTVLSRPRLRKSVSNQIDYQRAFESLNESQAARVREHIRTLISGISE